ncbi:hypothetical protein E4U21_005553 [Claviceps maximensis]|nr:hypothetical protein E4U21_005553 [Claviceps maximensis]
MMQLLPLALAATAAALVIIPEISESDEAIFRGLSLVDETSLQPILADSHVVRVPCMQCDDTNSNLYLNFSVVDDTRLLLNGLELYPHAETVVAAAAASPDPETTTTREQRNLGYSLTVVSEAMGKGSKLQLLDVELRVIEVGERFVDGVPAVNVRLFKAPLSEEIIIADVAVAPSKTSGCMSLACRAREGMSDALRALNGLRPFRGCHGRGGRWLHRGGEPEGKKPATMLPQTQAHGESRWMHSQSRRRHAWRRILTQIAAQILLPVLMGVTAGAGVALFAMATCSLLLRLMACVRGKRNEILNASSSAVGATCEEAFASEKDQKMGVIGLPRQYEDEDDDECCKK